MTGTETDRNRCRWANGSELMARYHDEEWGDPLHDDVKLFEFLLLETMQAGLSWSTVLNRREDFRRAFLSFDVHALSELGPSKIDDWMTDQTIIRNGAKLRAVITNARAFLRIQSEYGSFDKYQWEFVNGAPLIGGWERESDLPASTDLAVRFSKDLKRRGFSFIGPTTCYAHMQATGMVNDHVATCWKTARILE
jgi:DNA-3-methyladenine glycosylase I